MFSAAHTPPRTLLVLLGLCACGKPETPGRATKVISRVEAHSESSSVTALATLPPHLLVGTSAGLARWDLRNGAPLHFDAASGWPGGGVRAIAVRADDPIAWVATADELLRVDAGTGQVVAMVALAEPLEAADPVALAIDPVGGVWVGGPAGLYHADAAGGWQDAGFSRPVHALYAEPGGELWLAHEGGVSRREPDGSFVEVGDGDGLELGQVSFFVGAPDGSPIAVGDSVDQTTSLVAIHLGPRWQTFRPAPAVRFTAGTRQGDRVILAAGERLFTLGKPGGAPMLRREGTRLVALSGGTRSPYSLRPWDAGLPPGVTALSSTGDEVLVGTRGVGVARYQPRSPRPRWLRRAELVAGAELLTVACARTDLCFVATGGRKLWRWDGADFALAEVPDATHVLAVARPPGGVVHAVYLADNDDALHTARLGEDGFEPAMTIPLDEPLQGVIFARVAGDGLVWLGLRPRGVATLDLDRGLIRAREPVPEQVTDVSFAPGFGVWFATPGGAAHLAPGDDLEVFPAEPLSGLAVGADGLVHVATRRGVGVFDDGKWSFPAALAVPSASLAVGSDGRLWIGTDRGVVVYDGHRLTRVEAAAGLLAEPISRVTLDEFGRVWTLSAQGIGIIAP